MQKTQINQNATYQTQKMKP